LISSLLPRLCLALPPLPPPIPAPPVLQAFSLCELPICRAEVGFLPAWPYHRHSACAKFLSPQAGSPC